jgi:hypothetical protein
MRFICAKRRPRHYAHQPTRTYYNGIKHEDITSGAAGTRNGIDAMSKRGGIVGRGILLDFKAVSVSWFHVLGPIFLLCIELSLLAWYLTYSPYELGVY